MITEHQAEDRIADYLNTLDLNSSKAVVEPDEPDFLTQYIRRWENMILVRFAGSPQTMSITAGTGSQFNDPGRLFHTVWNFELTIFHNRKRADGIYGVVKGLRENVTNLRLDPDLSPLIPIAGPVDPFRDADKWRTSMTFRAVLQYERERHTDG
ncbi:MAG: hypothetical protein ACLFQX_08240 [Candidatus Kapaibacterium sp.]